MCETNAEYSMREHRLIFHCIVLKVDARDHNPGGCYYHYHLTEQNKNMMDRNLHLERKPHCVGGVCAFVSSAFFLSLSLLSSIIESFSFTMDYNVFVFIYACMHYANVYACKYRANHHGMSYTLAFTSYFSFHTTCDNDNMHFTYLNLLYAVQFHPIMHCTRIFRSFTL